MTAWKLIRGDDDAFCMIDAVNTDPTIDIWLPAEARGA